MKVLVTGYTGQLGFDVIRELKTRNIECIGTTRNEFSLIDIEKMQAFVKAYKPDVVIHCAAYTAVDKAEDEVELCDQINHLATKELAKVCKEIDAKMIYVSTDYVFAGSGEDFYEVNDEKAPQNVYGKSKLDGELAVQEILDKYFIVRISWVFGEHGNNFVKTMLRLGKEHKEINVVSDQYGSPTYTADLAKLLVEMIKTEKYGIYHATNEGVCSWAEFAEEIFKIANMDIKVNYIRTKDYQAKAKRPLNSRLSKFTLLNNKFLLLPNVEFSLKNFLKKIGVYNCIR